MLSLSDRQVLNIGIYERPIANDRVVEGRHFALLHRVVSLSFSPREKLHLVFIRSHSTSKGMENQRVVSQSSNICNTPAVGILSILSQIYGNDLQFHASSEQLGRDVLLSRDTTYWFYHHTVREKYLYKTKLSAQQSFKDPGQPRGCLQG